MAAILDNEDGGLDFLQDKIEQLPDNVPVYCNKTN